MTPSSKTSNINLKFKDATLPITERVSILLSQMTLEEKIAQMMGIWDQKKTHLLDEDRFNKEKADANLKNGIGQIGRISDTAGGLSPKDMANLSNKIQKYFVEETRLGIPVIFHEECLHGLVAKDATSYPQPIGLAATFNPELIEQIYSSVAEDARSRGCHQALTPVVDVARDPRWGRVEETFGEDPFLVAQLGQAAVRGFQGEQKFTKKKNIIATLKHFAAHGQPESGTNCGPVNVSERLLRDTFLYPFKEAIQKAKALCVMASYNEIDGISSHANPWLLKTILRDEWHFEGFIVSDYYAITELNERPEAISHSMAKDKKEAALLAAKSGVSVELPEIDCYPNLIELVKENKLDISIINEHVSKVLEYKFKMGLFEDPYVDPEKIKIDERLEKERPIALQAAHETVTLLKNDNQLLPLQLNQLKNIAIIGPNADRVLLGGYSGKPRYYTTILEGIKEHAGQDINVLYSEGCKITVGGSWNEDEVVLPDPKENDKLIQEAIEVANQADITILALGGNEQTSREAWDIGHMGDRADLNLLGRQNDLVKAVVDTGKPVIVILIHGRPNSINYIKNNVPAILECWYLGQETGNAIANVLFGKYNPSGKLPMSIPRSVGHIPSYYNYKPSARRGYLFDKTSALFPFGFGLSYTTFKLDNVKLSNETIKKEEATKVSVDIKNTGDLKGTEVVQLYIRDLVSSVTRPIKELKGFQKVQLDPGENKTITFEITPELLSFTNIDMEFTVEPGDFEIMVGTSSQDKDLLKTILKVK